MLRLYSLLSVLVLAVVPFVTACPEEDDETASTTATTAATTTSSTVAFEQLEDAEGTVTQLVVGLNGEEQVPPVEIEANGIAFFTIGDEDQNIQFRLDVTNLDNPAAAHTHLGPRGENGPVIVTLFDGPAETGPFNGTLAEGEIGEDDFQDQLEGEELEQLLLLFLTGPTYVNVHTAENPDGEPRGQIAPVLPGLSAATTTTGTEQTTTTTLGTTTTTTAPTTTPTVATTTTSG